MLDKIDNWNEARDEVFNYVEDWIEKKLGGGMFGKIVGCTVYGFAWLIFGLVQYFGILILIALIIGIFSKDED